MGAVPLDFDQAERRLLDAADDLLPALAVARRTTEVLASMVEGVRVPPEEEDAPPSYFNRWATLLLSVIGLRTARAGSISGSRCR